MRIFSRLDGFRIGRIIGEYLLQLGHQRIAFVTSTFETKQVTRVRRLEGLPGVYEEQGLDSVKNILVCSPESELSDAKAVPEGYELGYHDGEEADSSAMKMLQHSLPTMI